MDARIYRNGRKGYPPVLCKTVQSITCTPTHTDIFISIHFQIYFFLIFHFHAENIPISHNDSSNILLRFGVAAHSLFCDWHHRFIGVIDFDYSITAIYWLHILIGAVYRWCITEKSLLDFAMVHHQYISGHLDRNSVHAQSIWSSILHVSS